MAIAYRSSAYNQSDSAASLTITKPSGVVNDDIMIALLYVNSPQTLNDLAGWTLLQTYTDTGNFTATAKVYWKRADGEGADYTWTPSASTRISGGITAFSGCITTESPIDAEDGQVNDPSTSVAPGITTNVANTMLVWGSVKDNNTTVTFTPPSGMAEAYEQANDGSQSQAYVAQAAAGATGDKNGTNSAEGTHADASFLLALKPPGAAPATTVQQVIIY